MWNPFKKKDPLEGQRANYALAFDIVPKVLNAFNTGNMPLTELENVSTFMNFADDSKNIINLKSASNLNGNLNCSKELEHYAS